MVLVSLNTGCRRGELTSLSWRNVDIDRNLLTVSGCRTKNGQSRVVNLNKEAVAVFKRWKRQSGGSLVFPNGDGKPLSYLKTAWSKVLRDAEIVGFRWHDLRHTFASNLVMKGVDLNTVRELLGHGDISMTLRYAHLSSEHKAEAVEKLCA
jgi:integrase